MRTIKGATLWDKIRCHDIREELDVRWVRIRKRFWIDSVERMPEDKWEKWAKIHKPGTRGPQKKELELSVTGIAQKKAKRRRIGRRGGQRRTIRRRIIMRRRRRMRRRGRKRTRSERRTRKKTTLV